MNFVDGNTNEDYGGKLCVLCDGTWQVRIVSIDSQHITISLAVNEMDVFVSFVYARSSQGERKGLWDELLIVVSNQDSWIIVGDFSIIISDDEWRGGLPRPASAMIDFNNCIDSYDFV